MAASRQQETAPARFDGRGLLLRVRPCCGLSTRDFAFPPTQVLADAVGGQLPFAPAFADGALGHAENCGYLAGGQQAV
jgi:hypothetical protein